MNLVVYSSKVVVVVVYGVRAFEGKERQIILDWLLREIRIHA